MELIQNAEELADILIRCLHSNHKIMVCGNGGSAAQALHFTAELIGRFETERRSLPCICLNADQSTLTAIGNDYGFERVFSRQVEGLGQKYDAILLITTSGNSDNLVHAARMAQHKEMTTIALSGRDGGALLTDYRFLAPGVSTAEIQENHLRILHSVCRVLDKVFIDV